MLRLHSTHQKIIVKCHNEFIDVNLLAFYFDQIALIPKSSSMSIFNASHAEDERQIIEANNCEEIFPSGTKFCTDRVIVEACKAPLKSMSMFAFEGGFARPCECSSTGSESSICDKYCGQCPCKTNVAGRKCDRCAISFYGFNADGCLRKYHNSLYIYHYYYFLINTKTV